MGGGALAYALALEPFAERAVLIAGPASLSRVLMRYADMLALPSRARARLIEIAGRRMGVAEHDLDLEFLPEPDALRVLVVHDEEDKDLPVAEARRIKERWPHSSLHLTRGLGHRRVLSDPDTVWRIVAFLREP